METIFGKHNPRALHLDGLDSMTKKVTIGFKCNPKIKLKLAQDANKYGLALSEYIENLLLDLEGAHRPDAKQIFELSEKLAFYENDILKNLFKQYESQEMVIKKADGEDFKIRINEPKDIYSIIINSYKTKK
ncbi:MAG: hypothetical protein ABIN67_13565 [Ferruginibacter sp.]